MTRRYETVYILDSALEEAAINEKLERFHALLGRDGRPAGVTVHHWGKRTLAYAVRKKDTGYYIVAQFEAAPDQLPEYERAVKLDEGVLRFLVVAAPPEVAPVPVAAAERPRDDDDEEQDA
jgi:small subunit ribosomal protein S6